MSSATTSITPIPTPPARSLSAPLALLVCAWVLGLSVLPPSTTRLQAWPWAGFAALAWLLPLAVALYRLALGRPCARFGGCIDAGFALLALSALVSAFTSPLRGVVIPHLLPFLGTCALPYALIPLFHSENDRAIERIGAGMITLILGTSLLLWWEPWHHLVLPGSRNAQPFGHANITGSVAVLAALWLAAGALREKARTVRLLFAAGALLAVATAVSSGSRGAVIALAAASATAAAIILIKRGRLLVAALCALLLAGAVVTTNTHLRELIFHGRWNSSVRESNDQRTTMILGGLRLGAERPLLGWGPGAVPHVFPRVRADLPGGSDNFLQLHNTPAQLWATLGSAGLLATLLIAAGIVARLRTAGWTHEQVALTAGLTGAATLLLFDHPFATPVFALLATAHLAAWARSDTYAERLLPRAPRMIIGGLGMLLLLPVLYFSGRDLAARREFAGALEDADENDRAGYVAGLRRASALAPADAYYPHLLAAHYATGHPFPGAQGASIPAALDRLRATLSTNPDLEYAHYNLGWLLLESSPAASAAHFLESIRLAPQR
ncbi:MAG: O-antigen ligase family protein, partial [Opitutaceae bacterium]|nr:O-antigen ligase family protein [Opitutaceae bacterium]